MEDYREIGPPGNGKTRKTGASNLAAVRETTRHVRIHASRVIFRGALNYVRITVKSPVLLPGVHSRCHQTAATPPQSFARMPVFHAARLPS